MITVGNSLKGINGINEDPIFMVDEHQVNDDYH